jgi:hypothetical protein
LVHSIDSWDQLEQKFYDHFFSGNYQPKLIDLTSVRKSKKESVSDYLKHFKEVKNCCFNLSLTDSDLADLVATGLRPYIRDRLEGVEFHTLANVLVRGMAQELKLNKEKEHSKPHRSNVHMIEYNSDSSDDENEVYVAEFLWLSRSKGSSCASLKPATKGLQEELKFTFDVFKCDRIFDELLKLGNIKISHIMPPLDEIKRRAYCKFHISYSHATNDCNVFRCQIQSTINEGRLMLHEMQVDNQPFPINTMELQQPKVLVRPHPDEATKGKYVMVGEAKLDLRGKELTREVVYEKTLDGRETFKIIVKASGHGVQGSSTLSSQQATEHVLDRAVRPGVQGGKTAPAHGRPKMLVPKRPEIGNWKLNVAKNQGSIPKPKVTFDMLFDKYSKQMAVTSDQPVKRMRSPSHQERPTSPPRAAIRYRGESSQRQHFTPDWAPTSSNLLRPIYDDNGVMWVPYQQPFNPRWGGPRRSALDQISIHAPDRWAP